MSWADGYVGTPYRDLGRSADGCDCWGLARIVYSCELKIILPTYSGDYISADEKREIAQLIAVETADTTWTLTGDPQPFDLLVFRQGRYGSHIGIYIDHNLMLHMAGEDHAKVERHTEGRWRTRLLGVYRHLKHPSNVEVMT